ncbi:MAG: hypothetical protein ACRDS0_26775 [Pseudonocardiaceae bacterium]
MTSGRGVRRARRAVAVPVTGALDGFEHLVAEEAMAPGNAGRYATLCGREVWAAALAAPAGLRCPACATIHNGDAVDRPRHSRPTRRAWTRLVGLLRRPCPARSEPSHFPDVTLPSSGVDLSAPHQSIRQ